jgi:DNA-binding transcriptional MerR regulator
MFRIGEFSTIARVSDVLLRHYDDVDLFKPAHVDPQNGYRYYAIEQLPQLNRILALRDLGLSLAEIKKLVRGGVSTAEIQGMLRLQQAQIEQTIADEQSRLRRVQARLQYVQSEGALPDYDVVLKSLPAQPFLSLRQKLPSIADASRYYYELGAAVAAHRVPGLSHCAAVFHEPAFRVKNVAWELGFLLDEPFDGAVPLADGRQLTVRRLPPVAQAATCVHVGPWSEMRLAFAAIGAWMASNDCHLAGPTREVYLNLVPPGQDDAFAVEVQIPVR